MKQSVRPAWGHCSGTKSCPTLGNPMDCSPPGSSVHGTSQARVLDGVAMPFSRGSSPPRDRAGVPALAGGFSTAESPGKPPAWRASYNAAGITGNSLISEIRQTAEAPVMSPENILFLTEDEAMIWSLAPSTPFQQKDITFQHPGRSGSPEHSSALPLRSCGRSSSAVSLDQAAASTLHPRTRTRLSP